MQILWVVFQHYFHSNKKANQQRPWNCHTADKLLSRRAHHQINWARKTDAPNCHPLCAWPYHYFKSRFQFVMLGLHFAPGWKLWNNGTHIMGFYQPLHRKQCFYLEWHWASAILSSQVLDWRSHTLPVCLLHLACKRPGNPGYQYPLGRRAQFSMPGVLMLWSYNTQAPTSQWSALFCKHAMICTSHNHHMIS